MEYVDLPLLKEYVNEQTTSADALLTQCLKTACRQIESQTGRRFYQDELQRLKGQGSSYLGGSGSRVMPVLAKKPARRSVCC